jgi:integrase
LQLRNSSEETITTYLGCVERFARYYGQSPEQLNAEQVRSYLLYLLGERKLSWPALHVNRAALRFLSVRVLKQRWFDEEIQCPKRPLSLPTVLSADEITRLLEHTRHLKHWTMLATLYATGLRSKELRLLKVSDIDSQRMVLHIRNGKGQVPRDLSELSKILLQKPLEPKFGRQDPSQELSLVRRELVHPRDECLCEFIHGGELIVRGDRCFGLAPQLVHDIEFRTLLGKPQQFHLIVGGEL